MASSSTSYMQPTPQSSSSSSQSPLYQPTVEDNTESDADSDDPVANHIRNQALLAEDPLEPDGEQMVSFKRKQKQASASRFLSAFAGSGASSQATPSPRYGTPNPNGRPLQSLDLNIGDTDSPDNTQPKDGGPLDWNVEGPGRRVGYGDMTAIDWIFEYTKERQRLRMLYSKATGLLGYVQKSLDASQIWVVLILTGLAVGVLAATIDIASDWLADIKTGYCTAGEDGGGFYLNKYFCCYGYDGIAQCRDWVPWSLALNITSGGGKWVIEYFFYIAFSVCSYLLSFWTFR